MNMNWGIDMSNVLCRRLLLFAVAAGLCTVAVACSSTERSSGGDGEVLYGEASYYGDKFAGRTTANGETFDPSEMTAAHRSLPFDTKVRVTRVGGASNASVVVRINDRGPYAEGRIIDLSEGAARKIGLIGDGVAEVKIEVLDTPSESNAPSRSSGADEQRAAGSW